MKKDINYIQNLEKAIEQKYGLNATLNPKHFWNEEKEKDYIEETKKVLENERKILDSSEKIEIDGILMPKKLINKSENKICSLCKKYSFDKKDDVYMNKFKSCYRCYLCYIEEK
jgi:hypothetical protein